MENKIQSLYCSLHTVSVEYLTGINRKNSKRIKELVPEIQQFATWFLDGDRFGAGQKLYQELSIGLLQILEDITEALGQEDCVLLHDAVAYGLLEYLELFTEREDWTDDSL